jgi:hypothetical protein
MVPSRVAGALAKGRAIDSIELAHASAEGEAPVFYKNFKKSLLELVDV